MRDVSVRDVSVRDFSVRDVSLRENKAIYLSIRHTTHTLSHLLYYFHFLKRKRDKNVKIEKK